MLSPEENVMASSLRSSRGSRRGRQPRARTLLALNEQGSRGRSATRGTSSVSGELARDAELPCRPRRVWLFNRGQEIQEEIITVKLPFQRGLRWKDRAIVPGAQTERQGFDDTFKHLLCGEAHPPLFLWACSGCRQRASSWRLRPSSVVPPRLPIVSATLPAPGQSAFGAPPRPERRPARWRAASS
jgi:hypothetical protein